MEDTSAGLVRTGDIVTLTIYLVGTLGLGLWIGTKTKTTEGYFLGGRKMPGWAVGLSLLGSAISSITFLAYPGSAYAGNYSRIVPGLTWPIGAVFAVLIFIPFYRKAGYVSAYAFYERRFGLWARMYVCVLYSIAQVWRMGLILYLLSMAITSMHAAWNLQMVMIALGIFVTLYTVLGGIEAVIWTDVFQTIALVLGGLAVIAVVFLNIEGGAWTVISMGMEHGKFSLIGQQAESAFDFSLARDTLFMLIVIGTAGNILGYAVDQTYVQRFCAASTEKGARRAVWTGALGAIPVWLLFMFVGTCLWAFYQLNPEHLHREMLADEIFPYFILHELPSGLGGLVIAGVLAAAMSSIDSSMSATSTTLTIDVYRRLLVKGRDDPHYLKAAKAISAASGALMILVGLGLTTMRQEAILDVAFVAGGLLACGIGGLFSVGFFTRRANSFGALLAVIFTVVFNCGMTYIEAKAMIWESRASWMVQAAVEQGQVDVDALQAAIHAEAEARGTKLTLADAKAEQEERIREQIAPQIESELGAQPPHLGEAVGVHSFMMGVVTCLIVYVLGYLFSFLRPRKPLAELGGLTWQTRHMKRSE